MEIDSLVEVVTSDFRHVLGEVAARLQDSLHGN